MTLHVVFRKILKVQSEDRQELASKQAEMELNTFLPKVFLSYGFQRELTNFSVWVSNRTGNAKFFSVTLLKGEKVVFQIIFLI